MGVLAKISSRVWVAAGLLALAAVILVTGVGTISRTFATNKFAWSFEVVGIAFIWVTALGTVMAEGARENVAIDMLDQNLSPKPLRVLRLVRHVITTLIMLAILFSGWAMLQRSAFTPTPVMRLPMWVQHGAIVVMAAGIIAVQFYQALKLFRKDQ